MFLFAIKHKHLQYTQYSWFITYAEKNNNSAPLSDRKPAQTGSQYQCSVYLYHFTAEQIWEAESFDFCPPETIKSEFLTNDSQSVSPSPTHDTFHWYETQQVTLNNNNKPTYVIF